VRGYLRRMTPSPDAFPPPVATAYRVLRIVDVVPLAGRGAAVSFEGLLVGAADSKFRSRAGL